MSIGTYDDLTAALANWLERDDLTARIPEFIALGEAQIARDLLKSGGVRQMVARATATISDEFSAVPSDFLAVRSYHMDGYGALEVFSADEMADRKAMNPTVGTPRAYAVVGGEFEYYPVPQEAYSGRLTYYTRPPALSSVETSNWLLDEAPDVYLYAALMQAAPYLVDDARLSTWGGLYRAAVDGLIAAESFATYGGAPSARRRSFG